MRIGFHIPFSGNLKRLSNEVTKTRGNAFQFYSRSIRGGKIPKVSEQQVLNYYNFLFEKKISTIIMLAPYLFRIRANEEISTNLAVKNPRAVEEIIKDLEYAKLIHAKYYIINAGYAKGQTEFEAIEHLKMQVVEILEATKWEGTILIRNMCGGGTEVAGNLNRWNEAISFHERVKGVLDFGRAFAYGYSFLKDEDASEFLEYIRNEIGWDKIPLVYLNDSNRFSGSKREDVAPLGEGVIGWYGYSKLLNDRYLLEKTWIVENQPNASYYDRSIEFLISFHKKNKKN